MMAAATDSASLVPIQPVFTDAERLALAGKVVTIPLAPRTARAIDLDQCGSRTASSSSLKSATGPAASATATTSASTRSAGCSQRRAANSAARGQATWKDPCGSCVSGFGMLRPGSHVLVYF
jgi:hypothetical protein